MKAGHWGAIACMTMSLVLSGASSNLLLAADGGRRTPSTQPKLIKLDRLEAARGDRITVTGENFGLDVPVRVKLNDMVVPGTGRAWDAQSFSFVVPDTVKLGRYRVSVAFEEAGADPANLQWNLVPAATVKEQLLVVPPPKDALKLDSVRPATTYPGDDHTFGFTILGRGFSSRGEDNEIEVEKQGKIPIEWVNEWPVKSPDPMKIYGHVVSDREIELSHIPSGRFQPPVNVFIRVGEETSSSVPIVLSLIGKWKPVWFALAVVGIFAALVLIMLGVGHRRSRRPNPEFTILDKFLLDTETDTYSLSKVQFLLWTLAAVFGYVYFTLVRTFVQGSWEFPDIPATLPGLIFVSASTTVFAQGIQAVRGPKGAGAKHPGVADLFTSGGVVAPERFQFLIWTFIGVIVFLGLLILKEPGDLQSLPSVPQGMLLLMGVSSAGYLGGKLARSPGPVIDEIIARSGSLRLEIRGRNLSPDATIRIGPVNAADQQNKVEFDKIAEAKKAGEAATAPVPEVAKQATLRVLEFDEQVKGSAKKLLLVIDKDFEKWATDAQDLTLENPDGQKATWQFQATSQASPPDQKKPVEVPQGSAQNEPTATDVNEARLKALAEKKPPKLDLSRRDEPNPGEPPAPGSA